MTEDEKKIVRLSKSKLMRGIQCPKALYLTIHNPDLEPPVDEELQAVFDQGHTVGLVAQKAFPGGVTITAPYYEPEAAVSETKEAIGSGATSIYEAALEHDNIHVKIDVLKRDGSSAWELVEVKSSTSVKKEHFDDVAIQTYVAEQAGLTISKCFLMHLNNKSTAPELKDLFTLADITEDVRKRMVDVPGIIASLRKTLDEAEAPSIDIGPHCSSPYDCPFKDHCWKHVRSPSVFEIPYFSKKAWEAYKNGIIDARSPDLGPFTGKKANQVEAIRSGKRWVDQKEIQKTLSTWKWPLHFLDFETIAHAIPVYDGTHPYENIPFQFSNQTQTNEGDTELKDAEFLHQTESDPRRALAEALLASIGPKGNIVAYNMSFEGRCLAALADCLPDLADQLVSLKDRLVDPLPIFRNYVYDVGFAGSFSIKSVAPTLIGESLEYEGMEIADGRAAQRGFLELISSDTSEERKKALTRSMLAYCRQDTKGMVELVNWLLQYK